MLRHARGFKLANDGAAARALRERFGYQNIQHTVRYAELIPTRFKSFFEDED
jgi:site-specific recombinase XerD